MATNDDPTENSLEALLTEKGARTFLSRTVPALTRLVPRWCPEVAWDASVDAYLAIAAHPERYQVTAQASAYAYTKVRRDRARARRLFADREVAWTDGCGPVDRRTPDRAVAASEQLWRALARLPDHLRRTVVAVKGEGFTAAEFARLEGIAEQTVTNRVHIALRRLREFLREDEVS